MRLLKMLAAMALALTGWAAQAGPYFASKDGSMVWDQATGLVWMRCSLGQRWDGKTCAGEAKKYTFEAAQQTAAALNGAGGFGGHRDWQVPTVRQLAGLVLCSKGVPVQSRDVSDGSASVPSECPAGSARPTTDPTAFPGTLVDDWYWSSSPSVGDADFAWNVYFNYGLISSSGRYNYFAVRLVRASQLLGGEAAFAFPRELPSPDDRAWAAVESSRMAEVEARKAEADARESAAKREALKRQLAPGAQGLYLQAAQKQRSGDTSEAARLYELIIEHFPTNPLAVKAADQLTAMSRSASSSRSSASSGACSHLYVGKTIELRNPTFGYTVNAEIRGLGSTRASVRYRHPLTGDIESNELDCNTLR